MTRGRITTPFELFQGEDRTETIYVSDDLTSATEIEFTIDTPTQIKKTLSGAHISAVTTTQFTLQIDAADTSDVPDGPYRCQARSTISGKLKNIRFKPDKVHIRESVFVDLGSGNDYQG